MGFALPPRAPRRSRQSLHPVPDGFAGWRDVRAEAIRSQDHRKTHIMSNISSAHTARLRAAEREFVSLTTDLSPTVLPVRLVGLASKFDRNGKERDPLIAALAQQALDGITLRDKAAANKAEHGQLRASRSRGEHVLGHRQSETERLARIAKLEEENDHDIARLVHLAGDQLGHARAQAVDFYAAEDARAERIATIKVEAAALAAQTAAPSHAVQMAAAAIRTRREDAVE